MDTHKEQLAEELSHYENKWVAIYEPDGKVVGSGSDAYEAKLCAERNGYPEITLFKVRPFNKYYIPLV
jgi:hypothetical protein